MTSVRTVRGAAGTGGPSRPVIPRPGCEGDDRVDGVGAARELWDALTRARAEYAPLVLAAAEQAVFRFYLPLAQTLASAVAPRRVDLSLIHISEPTRRTPISYAVFCLKKKKI